MSTTQNEVPPSPWGDYDDDCDNNNNTDNASNDSTNNNTSGGSSSISPNYTEQIKSDPDYLYRLLRNQQSDIFFQAIDEYMNTIDSAPFNTTFRVHLFDSLSDKSIIPTLSLLEALYSTDESNRKLIPKFLHKYFKTVDSELMIFLLEKIELLRIFIINFPTMFDSYQFNTPRIHLKEVPIALCTCQIDPTINNINCFCSLQNQLMFEHELFNETLTTSFNKFACYPCNPQSKFPNHIHFEFIPYTQTELRHFRGKSKVKRNKYEISIQYSQYGSFYDILTNMGKFDDTLHFHRLLLSPETQTPPAYANYSELQRKVELAEIHGHHKFGLACNKLPDDVVSVNVWITEFVQQLQELLVENHYWVQLWYKFLQTHSNAYQNQPISTLLNPSMVKSYEELEKLLFRFIEKRPTEAAHSTDISHAVYNMLLSLLYNSSIYKLPSNCLLRHIVSFYIPYLCPWHLSIVLYVLPVSLLQNFHPAMFLHFNNNSIQFKLSDYQSIDHPLRGEYNKIITLQKQREHDSTALHLSRLPIHPIALVSAYLSPHQYDPKYTRFEDAVEFSTKQKSCHDQSKPTFAVQLTSVIKQLQHFPIYLDCHLGFADDQTSWFSCLEMYINPYITAEFLLDVYNRPHSKARVFFDSLSHEYNSRSFSRSIQFRLKLDVANSWKVDPLYTIGPHNRHYFAQFHNDEQKELLGIYHSAIEFSEYSQINLPKGEIVELFMELESKAQYLEFMQCLNRISSQYNKNSRGNWGFSHPLYDELQSFFPNSNIKGLWVEHLAQLKREIEKHQATSLISLAPAQPLRNTNQYNTSPSNIDINNQYNTNNYSTNNINNHNSLRNINSLNNNNNGSHNQPKRSNRNNYQPPNNNNQYSNINSPQNNPQNNYIPPPPTNIYISPTFQYNNMNFFHHRDNVFHDGLGNYFTHNNGNLLGLNNSFSYPAIPVQRIGY